MHILSHEVEVDLVLHDGCRRGCDLRIHIRKGLNNMTSLVARLRSDVGMTTAEYAVGTCAAAGIGGLLIKIVTSSVFYDMILNVLKQAFSFLFN
jgi:hypothetical protein